MHILKRLFTTATGYYIYKTSMLPIGADLFIDIHKRLRYPSIKTIFDVGANIGQTWEWFRSNERNGKIYCFEPVCETFELLKIKTLKDKNCIAENIVLGAHRGEKTINLYAQNSALNSLRDDIMNPDSTAKKRGNKDRHIG